MVDMKKVHVGYQQLANDIFIYRTGKRPHVALDQREAFSECVGAIFDYLWEGDTHEGKRSLEIEKGDKKYQITVTVQEG